MTHKRKGQFTKKTASTMGARGGKKTRRKYGREHYKALAFKRWNKK